MKKVFLIAAIAVSGFAAQAQTPAGEGFSQGSLFISGNVGFSSMTEPFGEEEYKTSSFMFNPRLGYFVSQNIAVGINFGIGSTKETNSFDDSESKVNEMSVGAFGRYYFTPANKFSMFMHLGADYASMKMEEDGEEIGKFTGFNVGLAPGINYFISNRLALESTIGVLSFTSAKPDVDGADATTNFNFNLGLNNITFGLVYKLK